MFVQIKKYAMNISRIDSAEAFSENCLALWLKTVRRYYYATHPDKRRISTERLELLLQDAVSEQDFEYAAEIRDELSSRVKEENNI